MSWTLTFDAITRIRAEGVSMEKWVVTAKKADFYGIGERFSIDPVVARLIRNRDLTEDAQIEKYLHGSLKDLYPPKLMKGMAEAGRLLQEKMGQGKKIRIIGDYDIDGIMSSYILHRALRRLGGDCDVRIPDRIVDGYGLNEHLVTQAAEEGVDTILTCDNGISAAPQIALAESLGMTTIVTDHHEVPYQEKEGGKRKYILPPAGAVVNPKQADCPYPFRGLCGAAVAWKLVCYLYDLAGIASGEKEDFLEYVAIATVGDVMDLQDENRILVKEGLKRLHATSNLGLQELMAACKIQPDQVEVYHIGFVLGPCLNASGRLDTALRALKLLEAQDREEAARLAGDLKALNESRKAMTEEGAKRAMELVETSPLQEDRVLVVYLPDCHESLAGIIAGRLKEHYHKPSFVLTRTEEGVKGSGRSIESYSMYEELCRCDHCVPCLTRFGGHPMAAGLSLPEEKVDIFRETINRLCSLTPADLTAKITIDVAMPIRYVSPGLLEQMDLMKPFGKGNAKPLFAQKNMQIRHPRIFGKNRNVVKMQVADEEGYAMEAIYFGDAEKFVAYAQSHPCMALAYYPNINSYMGRETLQITVTNYR